ncbi:MAG TPA: oligosaccharide flippase family protein [Bacteroidota bacterium]|nr:oligosaccharide flippase family protein [Bacteroidota bacterium]
MKRLSTINSFSGAAQIVINTVLLLFVVRAIIGSLGLQSYGVYALITAIGALGIFAGFGFNTSLIKYLAEQEDRQESNYDIAAVFLVIGGAASLVAVLSLLFNDFVLVRLLNIPRELVTPSVRFFYFACVGANLLQVVSQVPGAVLDAQQKVYVTNSIQLVTGVLSKCLMLISLTVAPSLAWLGWIMLGTSLTVLVLLIRGARRTWGRFSVPGWRKRFLPVARKHFAYSHTVYASSIVGYFYETVTKVLISHFAGLTEVGYFDLALRVRNPLWMVLDRLAYPVLPKIAAKKDIGKIRVLVEEAEQKLALIVVPIAVAVLSLSGPIVVAWLGSYIPQVAAGIDCVVGSYMVAVLFIPLYQFLLVKGHPEKALILQCCNLGITVVGIAVFVPFFGYMAAVCAYSFGVLASTAGCAWYQHRFLHSSPFFPPAFRIKLLKLALSLAAVNAAGLLLGGAAEVRLAVMVALNAVAVVFLFRVFTMITPEDLDRYFGRKSRTGMFVEWVFLRGGQA